MKTLNIKKTLGVMSLLLVAGLAYQTSVNTNSSSTQNEKIIHPMKNHAWVVEVGQDIVVDQKFRNVPGNADGSKFVTTGNETYIAVGRKVHMYSISPKMDTEIGLKYINVGGKSHTGAFYVKLGYIPTWYDGDVYLEGAVGMGIDYTNGQTVIDGDTTYTSTDDPKTMYSKIGVGTNFILYKDLVLNLGVGWASRSYDLKLEASNTTLNSLEQQTKSLDSNNIIGTVGLKYKF